MNSHLDEILKLSREERLHAVEAIWDSIAAEKEAPEFSKEQTDEIKKRIKKIDSGQMKFASWKEVKQRIKNRL